MANVNSDTGQPLLVKFPSEFRALDKIFISFSTYFPMHREFPTRLTTKHALTWNSEGNLTESCCPKELIIIMCVYMLIEWANSESKSTIFPFSFVDNMCLVL